MVNKWSIGYTTMSVSRKTHRRLTNVGRKNESYNQIIKRLLDEYEANHQGMF